MKNRFLVLGAMPQEIVAIKRKIKNAKKGLLAVFPYVSGELSGQPVVLAATGVGKTNAAMVASIFAFHFRPRALLFTGTGSRLNPSLRTGDIIIGKKTCHHDMGTLNEKGMQYRSFRGPLRGTMTPYSFPADPNLLKRAREAALSYKPRPVTANGETYLPIIRQGIICAGDVFGQSKARIREIREKLKADIMEMEGSSIGQVCRQLCVPHLVIRAGSNLTQENPSDDYRRLGPAAAHSAARFTIHFIGNHL